MGFTKLDEGILKSSIMAETPATFKVWIALLASCDYDGVARVSPIFLSAACHLSQSMTDKAIDILSSPDQYSRSDADEGRRIRNVDGGYFVINYQKYRAFTYSGSPDAVRKREYRKKVKDGDSLGHVGTCPGHSASASASASSSASSSENKKDKKPGIILILDEEPKRWEGITAEDKALWAKTYPGCSIDQILQEMIAYWDAQPKSKRKLNWKRTIVNRLKWLQDHGGTEGLAPKVGEQSDWLTRRKEKKAGATI